MALLDWDGKEYVALYNSFKVGSEKSLYALELSGYDEASSTLADGLSIGDHINAPFTTSDQDNDNRKSSNCATDFSGGRFCLFP